MINNLYAGKVVETLLESGAVKATKYMSPSVTIKATRRLYGGKIAKQSRTIDIVVTLGKPNYKEREFIKLAQKAGEEFPIWKIQLCFLKDKKEKPNASRT